MPFEQEEAWLRPNALAIVVLLPLLFGCSRRTETAAGIDSQVVARVGGQVVTRLELQNELRLLNVPDEKRSDPQMVRKALKDLVVRKYLVQQALESALDRQPNVLLEVLRAREQALANAYVMKRIVASAPSAVEVRSFIADNPKKFAERRLLKLEQVGIALDAYTPELADAVRDAASLDQVDAMLTQAAVAHERTVRSVSEADLPQELVLSLIGKRSAGDVVFVKAAPRGIFMKLLARDKSPLEGDAADALARQTLNSRLLQTEFDAEADAADRAVRYEPSYTAIMRAGTPP